MFCSKCLNSTSIRGLVLEEGRSRFRGCRVNHRPQFGALTRRISGLNRNCIISSLKDAKPKYICQNVKMYGSCGPPKPPPGQCGCPPQVPGAGRRIVPPPDCKPGPIPPNPCCPVFHHGTDTHKKYKYLFFFLCVPLILVQTFIALGHCPKPKGTCREYEYLRRRTKRFPWGDGNKTYFHNDHLNHLPEECQPPPLICDD